MTFIKTYWRLIAFGLVTLTVLLASVVGLLWLFGGPGASEEQPVAKVDITASERTGAAERASQFVLTAGSFGVNPASVTAESINSIYATVYMNSTAFGGTSLGTSRTENYLGPVQTYLAPGSTLSYASSITTPWQDYFREKENLVSYQVTATTPTVGQAYRTPDGETVIVPVEVTFTSDVTVYAQTDRSDFWDGVWNIHKRTFPDNKLTVSMVQDTEGTWKVYDATSLELPYLLSTWQTPDTTIYAQPETMDITGTLATGPNGTLFDDGGE